MKLRRRRGSVVNPHQTAGEIFNTHSDLVCECVSVCGQMRVISADWWRWRQEGPEAAISNPTVNRGGRVFSGKSVHWLIDWLLSCYWCQVVMVTNCSCVCWWRVSAERLCVSCFSDVQRLSTNRNITLDPPPHNNPSDRRPLVDVQIMTKQRRKTEVCNTLHQQNVSTRNQFVSCF